MMSNAMLAETFGRSLSYKEICIAQSPVNHFLSSRNAESFQTASFFGDSEEHAHYNEPIFFLFGRTFFLFAFRL
jgi:hypothetical protein